MRAIILLVFITSCGIEPPPSPIPPRPLPPQIIEPDYYCGDGYCDPEFGESEYNCIDCGYDPWTGCPTSGGACGDGVCCGSETWFDCRKDCGPVAFNPWDRDPGWIDPPRRQQ